MVATEGHKTREKGPRPLYLIFDQHSFNLPVSSQLFEGSKQSEAE